MRINTSYITSIFTIGLLIFSGSCGDKLHKYTQFTIDYSSSFVVPSNSGLSLPLDFYTPETETNSEQEFAVNNTRKDLLEKVNVKSIKLKITSPDGQTFGFLNDVYIYLKADGLDEVLVAQRENIPSDVGSTLDLNVMDQDLQEYIKKDKFTLRAKTITDKVTNRDVAIQINTQFFVDAKVLGQ
ncbi:hypothetical protein GC194_08855 [bacterium]|nr:hypothetical protein [bacterium]